jgi:threonine synthase
LLPFTEDVRVVSLFEGNTPLYDAPRAAEYCGMSSLRLKHQGCNPTGSFKDTGMTVAVTQALVLSARTVVCASTGNTSASLAAYAARANLACAIIVPEGQVSSAKLAQSLDYGAKVFEIEGNFDAAMRLVRDLAEDESIYLVNSINPFRIEGQKTVGAELLEQLDWQVPAHVVVPGGNLGNSSALGKGFEELKQLGLIDTLPKLSVVQAEGAAPLANLFESHGGTAGKGDLRNEFQSVDHPQTLATAIKIGAPVSWEKAWHAVHKSKGRVLTVSEQEIANAKAIIGRDGVGCEPASATTLAGIKRLVAAGEIDPGESVVAILTGNMLKDPDYITKYHTGRLREDEDSPPIEGKFANQPKRVKSDIAAILRELK